MLDSDQFLPKDGWNTPRRRNEAGVRRQGRRHRLSGSKLDPVRTGIILIWALGGSKCSFLDATMKTSVSSSLRITGRWITAAVVLMSAAMPAVSDRAQPFPATTAA